jgi:PD-(D/E)XK nuclease superfamily
MWHFASYHLWSLFSPAVGKEIWHCDRKRGYIKLKKEEPAIKALLEQDTIVQKIGLLAQRGLYEFHQETRLLKTKTGIDQVADILQLKQESETVNLRLRKILENYFEQPILLGKDVIQLLRGDEGFPRSIKLKQGNYEFKLYAAIDCIFREPDGRLHILDFKTGQSDFDRRQAFVYLLACQYLYPDQPAIASFYNLETCQWSEKITATSNQLKALQTELARIAKQHQLEKYQYWKNPDNFAEIFPANPQFTCQYCQFNTVCQDSELKR